MDGENRKEEAMGTELETISGAADLLARKIAQRSDSKMPLTSWPKTRLERERAIAEISNRAPGKLTYLNCSKCLNRGFFHRVDDEGNRYIEECECVVRRRNIERLQRSGLADMVKRYTLKTWQQECPEQKAAFNAANLFCAKPDGWFVVSGRPGTGKTHICTAVCVEMMRKGYDTRYVMWRDFAVSAKAAVNDGDEYARIVDPVKRVKVLYLDDFFKTGKDQDPTTADVNLAFEILNHRYNDSKLITIISTEYSLERMMDIDEAVGSRIYERCKRFYLPMQGENWRTK